ncbi:ejaculatory bulb-specific protein 3-like [Diabrotica undecimpunctata]|uniref:ejaculatory bulb-specific protein 3-like n=1 Tax=Diabrotica undecimpunctata TaxID=50387 RepID=UPI003B63E9E1
MKSLFALGLASIIIAVCVANQKYTTKYDNVDIDAIIKSERLLKNYFNCLMDEGPCNADGKELKSTWISHGVADGKRRINQEKKFQIWENLKKKFLKQIKRKVTEYEAH